MKNHRRRPESSPARRRGLAPLEFVAALPIIITIAALMYVVGAAGLVKSRAQVVARYANWRTASVRNGGGDPQPRNWSAPATLFAGGGLPLEDASLVWNVGPLAQREIRGPSQIIPPDVQRSFEIGENVHTGHAEYRRPVPMLEPVTGRKKFAVELVHTVLSDAWGYHEGPFGLPSNGASFNRVSGTNHRFELHSRGEHWFEFQEDSIFREMEGPRTALVGAGIFGVDYLDRDPELIAEYGFPPRDFHPRFPRGGWEGTARSTAAGPGFERHLDNVARVPGVMANAYLAMYRRQIRELEQRKASLEQQRSALGMQNPPDRAGIADIDRQIGSIDAEIAALQAKMAPIQRFLDALPDRNKP